jgi:nicotinate-nucleotide adenylyltransferase
VAALSVHGLTLEAGQRVGLLGGSFNPAHAGHAHVAETALRRLGLDRVVWLVSPQNPLKDASESAPLAERMASARAVATDSRMIVSDFETRAGTQYTVDTLHALKAAYPEVKFVWLMGSDNLAQVHRWRDWEAIFETVPVAVVPRPGARGASRWSPAARRFASARIPASEARTLADRSPPAWVYLKAPMNPLSSTAIRAGRSAALAK